MTTRWDVLRIGLGMAALAALAGCGSDQTQPVSPQDFYAPRTVSEAPFGRTDQPGILPLTSAQVTTGVPPPKKVGNGNSDVAAAVVRGGIQPVAGSAGPTTRPDAAFSPAATTMPFLASNQYMTLGTVVAVVNGTPIYANRILRLEADTLRALAREMDIAQFEEAAREKIESTIKEQEGNELEIAAAEHTLDPKDIALAKQLTARWKQEQVDEAGGSEQAARLRAKRAGEDFDEEEQEQNRQYLQRLYYARKIVPQVQVSGDDERAYYQAHIAQFTTPTEAVITIIEADPANLGGERHAAIARLQDFRKRALAGEDFATYAREKNDLPGAAGPGGNGGQMTLQPASLALTHVDKEVWKLQPGQISDVIEDHGAFYIFKVVSRQVGGVKSFADEAVQDEIYRTLFDEQLSDLQQVERQKLEDEAIANVDPQGVDAAVEMALQNYPHWARK